MSEVIHRCPPKGESLTPCCGRTPFELPRDDRMTLDPDLVTCPGPRPLRQGGIIGGPIVRRAEWIAPLPESPAIRSALGCDLPPAPPLITVTLHVRFCDSWDFIDWNAVLFPRWAALSRARREAAHRVRLAWRVLRYG